MKLLIVDDEPLLRKGIMKKMEQMDLPLEFVGEAGDGLEGMSRLAAGKPDIVITDIRMPGMDGLSFIREAKQVDPHLQFIIISGYEEFEYAKKGIQYGVMDYLLKPVDKDELRGSLMRIMEKVEQERQQSTLREELLHLRNRNDEAFRQRLLTQFIQNGKELAAADNDRKLIAMKERCREFAVVLFEVELPVLPHGSFLEGEEKLLWFAVANMISFALESSGREGVLFHHAFHEKVLVYVLGDSVSINDAVLQKELKEILDGINRYLRLTVTIGCGLAVKEIGRIQQSYQQARQALRDKMIHGRDRIFMAAHASRHVNRYSILNEEDEMLLFRYLNECSGAALNRWLERRIEAIVHEQGACFNHLESFCVELHLLYRKYLITRKSMPEWMIGEIDDVLTWLHDLKDWQDIAVYVKSLSDNIIGHLNVVRHSPEYDVMDEVKRYINASLHDQLSLQSIAERFYIHPNYLSRRFKERFGENFVNYLTGERVRKAEQLLRETELKIQQIAELVGFQDAAYFSSVFRKATGMTPVQCRTQTS